MIADIFLTWNPLTAVMLESIVCVSLAVGADVGIVYYSDKKRERKARTQLERSVQMIAEKKIAKPVMDSDVSLELGVFNIHATPARRRHAKV